MKIVAIEPGSIASTLDLRVGDDLLEICGERVRDSIDLRYCEDDPRVTLKIARAGTVRTVDIRKEEGERIGIELEEMKILSCGNDCIFCFVDQNPQGLRHPLYFRDGDYRLSFMYGNYTTMTNAGPAILRRIAEQHLSPQYISVHVTDPEIRRRLMGLKKDDRILEKIAYLHDHGIEMHTQIVLCPGINDGAALEKTVHDLYAFKKRIRSLAIVPVGLTDHRMGLAQLTKVDGEYAQRLLETVEPWQQRFRKETGRMFVYPSDEFYIVAGRKIPSAPSYDGFPQLENGVGLVRSFLSRSRRQAARFPGKVGSRRKLTLATGELAAGFMREEILPRLEDIANLTVDLEVVPNVLYGRSVTVAGLLSGKCLYSALQGRDCGDLLLLPPDIVNADGALLDDTTIPQLELQLNVPIMVFAGSWGAVLHTLQKTRRNDRTRTLLPAVDRHSQPA